MKYDIVFEGGGAKGMVFMGACEELFKRGHTFGRLLGTSAGAITATLLAAGYTPDEMLAVLNEKEQGKSVFAGFMGKPPAFTKEEIKASAIRRFLEKIDFKFVFDRWEKKLDDKIAHLLLTSEYFRHPMALIERGGWFSADRFVTWLSAKLDSGSWQGGQRAFSGMTLMQLFKETGVELSVVASDTTAQKIMVLNRQTAPDCPVVWAVRMSMSIPLVWDDVVWRSDWGHYLKRDVAGHEIVDGGLISNFPIELFISNKDLVVKLMGPKNNNPILGMLIDEKLPVSSAPAEAELIDSKLTPGELSTIQRLLRLTDTATTAHDNMIIEQYSHLIVRLPAAGYGTTEFDMTDERRDALVQAGRKAMAVYLNTSAKKAPLLSSKSIAGKAEEDVSNSAADRIATKVFN